MKWKRDHQKLSNEDESLSESDTDEDTKIRPSERPNWKEERLNTLRTLLAKRRDRENTTMQTKIEKTNSEPSGELNTRRELEIMQENITQQIEEESLSSSGSTRLETIHPTASLLPSLDLSEEIFHSSNLLRSTARELHSLMISLNPKPENRDTAVRLLDPDRVRASAECGKQIIATMRMQLDILKFQKEIKK